jgi:hypothetical protein
MGFFFAVELGVGVERSAVGKARCGGGEGTERRIFYVPDLFFNSFFLLVEIEIVEVEAIPKMRDGTNPTHQVSEPNTQYDTGNDAQQDIFWIIRLCLSLAS